MTQNKLFQSCALALMVCLACSVAEAQTITGSITGTVTDPTGAVVPGARISATNSATNISYTGASNDAGIYSILFLPPGAYKLTVEMSGFKTATISDLRILGNQVSRVDAALEIGESVQTVEVTGVAPVLQSESTQTGDTLTATKLTALPLKSRNFVSLTLLVPGSVSPNPEGMNNRFGARPYVNGNREQTNNFMLDGVDVNDSIDNRVGYSPNVDALEEVKVLTGNAAADYGNAGGATVMMTLKSGTNEFRGNLFHFLRNDKLDANGFFRNRSAATATRTGFKRNIFGGTLGGPIKADKAFFFVDYEGTEQRSGGPGNATVAPQAWRDGDLSAFPNVVVDPTTGVAFPNKQIPQSRIVNPVARKLFGDPALYPLPNQPGVGALGQTNNYGSSTASTQKNHQGDIKLDYRLSAKDSLSGRWSIGSYESFGSRAALPTSMTSGQEGPTQSVVLNWVRTFSPSIVNEARAAFSRIVINDTAVDWSGQLGENGNQAFGIPGGQAIPGLSSVTLGDGLTAVGSAATISNTADNKFIYYNNLTWQSGRHLLKMGGQFTRYQQNRYYAGNNGALGLFVYSANYSGLAYGDFLLDQLSRKGRGAATGMWGHRSWRSALFVQDDWKITRNLTLNFGLRWEYMEPLYEVNDRQVNVNTFTGELIFPGQGGLGRSTYNGYAKQFMPRFGFAWTPGGFGNKLVVRGGYAYMSFMEGTGANLRLPLNPPFFLETDFSYDVRTPGTITTGFADVVAADLRLDMPRPAGTVVPQLQGRAWDLNLRPQTTSQINFTLEYQLDRATSISAGYVAQKGTHLVAPHEANQPLPGSGPFSTWSNLNLRRPLINVLPNLGNIALTEASATMDYHSLQVMARRRFAAGLDFMVSYTYGKTLTDNLGYYGSGLTSGEGAYWQNAYDRRANRGLAFFDVRNNLTVGGTYDLPVGKGQKVNIDDSLVNQFLGGWNLNYNMALRSGLPITVRAVDRTGQAVRGNVRANRYRTLVVNESMRNVDNWFGLPMATAERTAFFCAAGIDNGQCPYGQPADGSFGNSSIGTERGPGFFNLDLSVGKKFNLSERRYFDFRAEFFNILNTVSWAPPGANLSTPASFGVIGSQVQNPRQIQFGLKFYF
ncbi:MAG: TonB-dependent receptor [Bryobacteraceae bacterium]|nr:TonB-dependent receptor [Solibacteraceae bacterium]MCO5350101.1 TonB-dependent receptor [Bryobacteraceae bacterium]